MAVLFIVIIMVMRVIQSVYSKRTSNLIPDGISSYIKYIAYSQWISAGFSFLFMLASQNFSGINAFTVGIAACSGLFLALSSLCSLKALLGSTMALSSICSTAGLILPCVIGIFAFREPLSLVQVVCIIVVLLSAYLLINSSKRISGGFSLKTLLYLIGSFVSNGMVMFCQKLFGTIMPDGNVALFSMLTFLIPAMVLTVLCLAKAPQHPPKEKFSKKLIRYSLYQAFAVFVIQQLVTMLTPVMSSAVLFTLVNGSATVIAAIVGAMMYKEKLTPKSISGIILGISALIFISSFS